MDLFSDREKVAETKISPIGEIIRNFEASRSRYFKHILPLVETGLNNNEASLY